MAFWWTPTVRGHDRQLSSQPLWSPSKIPALDYLLDDRFIVLGRE